MIRNSIYFIYFDWILNIKNTYVLRIGVLNRKKISWKPNSFPSDANKMYVKVIENWSEKTENKQMDIKMKMIPNGKGQT